ncbi:MAG: hypothetical protein H6825_15885 [Planctomycetes bacterium]|nr:hypothetical protein [Planctomycetota bacterium]
MSALVLLLSLALAGDGAPTHQAYNTEPWSYVTPPLVGHCLETYRLFLPPDALARPADGWPVLIHVDLSGFAATNDVAELTEESFLYHVIESGIAVVVARVTPSVLLDDEVWTTSCDPVPEVPGHGLLHPPGYVPPDLAGEGIAPYDDPGYPNCLVDAVTVVQYVRHMARGEAPFADDEAATLALLDPERIGISGRSAGAITSMWTALAADRRDEAPFAGLGGAYDEPTRVSVAVLMLGSVWFPLYRDDQELGAGFLGLDGDSEEPIRFLGEADPSELLPLSALMYEDRLVNGALPIYMLYEEKSVCTDYSPKTKGCGDLPFCFSGQGKDGVYGVHPAWHGYAWKRRHPARTRLVITDPAPFKQRKSIGSTYFEPGQAQVDDLVGWLHDAFASSDSDGLIDGVDAFVVPGDRVSATLAPSEERVLAFEGLAGSKITFDARRKGASAAEPTLALCGPDGQPRVAAGESVLSAKHARIAKFELDATGVYTLVLGNAGAEAGELKLESKAKNPPKLKQTLPLGGVSGVSGLVFDAVGGMQVRGTRVKRVKPPPDADVPPSLASELLPAVGDLESSGAFAFDLQPYSKTTGKGSRIHVDPFEVPAVGEFQLDLAALDDGQGFVQVRLRRVLPRGHEEYVLD